MEDQNLLLSKHCKNIRLNEKDCKTLAHHDYESKPLRLNFDVRKRSILALLAHKSFFKRFRSLKQSDHEIYERIMRRAQIELYAKDTAIFLQDRIGVVTMGSVEIRRHNNKDLMQPYIIKKAIEGDIIGWAEGDHAYSSSPLTWLISMQNDTEVVFISKKDWPHLWNIQRQFTEQQIVLQKLEQNNYFNKLNLQTKYHLVYESIELRVFYPGQLIMSVHERSPLCLEYEEFYKTGTSKFRKEIDFKITK